MFITHPDHPKSVPIVLLDVGDYFRTDLGIYHICEDLPTDHYLDIHAINVRTGQRTTFFPQWYVEYLPDFSPSEEE